MTEQTPGTTDAIEDEYGVIKKHVGRCRTCDRAVEADGSLDGFESVESTLAAHVDDGTACHEYRIDAEYVGRGERRVA